MASHNIIRKKNKKASTSSYSILGQQNANSELTYQHQPSLHLRPVHGPPDSLGYGIL